MLEFEEKMTKKKVQLRNSMKCIKKLSFKRKKRTYSKLDNALMYIKQLYIVPTLGAIKFWKSIKRLTKA